METRVDPASVGPDPDLADDGVPHDPVLLITYKVAVSVIVIVGYPSFPGLIFTQ